MTDPLGELRTAWGKKATVFPRWPVELENTRVSDAELNALLHELPAEQLVLRRTASSPGSDMDKDVDPRAVPDLIGMIREECLHVMALDLQQVAPDYAALLARFVDAVRPTLEAHGQHIVRSMVGLFLSSPGSVARYHADPEHNFLLQVRGTKELHVFPRSAERCFPWEAQERLFCDKVHYLDYSEAFESEAEVLRLGPGQGSYQPMLRPHWVLCGETPSLSIGFSLFTDEGLRHRRIHSVNRRLRRFGVRPSPPGAGPMRDGLKALAGAALSAVAGAVRGKRSA